MATDCPTWDDRHPFVTAEIFRKSTFTGLPLASLGGISSALGELGANNVCRHSDSRPIADQRAPSERTEFVVWDDRRPFFTAMKFGERIHLAPRIARA